MPRILKRPMFRSGGSTNEGIMHGLKDRKGFEHGTDPYDYEAEARKKYEAIPMPRDNALNDLLISGGLNLLSGKASGSGTLSNVASSFSDPAKQYAQSKAAANQSRYNRDLTITQKALEEQAKDRRIQKQLDAQKSLYDLEKSDVMNLAIMEQSQKFLDNQIYQSKAPADNHANWIYKKSSKYPQDKIGGVLTKKQLMDSKFAKTQGKKKGGVGTIYYDPFNDQVLEVYKVPGENEYGFRPVGRGEEVVGTTTEVVKDETFLESLTGKKSKPYTYEDMQKSTDETTQKIIDTVTTPVDLQDIDTSNIRRYR